MAPITILFADNSLDFLDTRAEFLEKAGYHIVKTTNFAQAQEYFTRGNIDLAILDLRLVDDDDEKDMSGLILANSSPKTIPVIILTGFPSVGAVREAFRKNVKGLSPAIDFVSKEEGPDALLASVRRAIAVHIDKQPKPVVFNISEQLEKDFEESRKQAVLTHRVRLILLIVGTAVIIIGAIGALLGQTAVGVLSAVSGIIANLLAAFFSKLSENANKRMDKYHKELLKLYMNQDD